MGQIRIKANIKELSLQSLLAQNRSSVTILDAVPYSGGHWFREFTTFYSSKKRNEAKNTRYKTVYFLELTNF